MLYLIFAILLFSIEMLYFKLARRFNIVDSPNSRSSHTIVTIRGGGIVFYVSLLLYGFYFGFNYPWFLVGATIIAIISFWDDLKSISSKIRLSIQLIAMLVMLLECGIFEYPMYYWIISIFLLLGVINAFNFMDGINGITGGYSLVVLLSLWYINNNQYEFVDNQLIYLVGLSVLVFNFFNFRKRARCFAGDVGSITIAFIICFFMMKLILFSHDLSYLILLGVYGVDVVLTILHRIIRKENLLEAHRMHNYQLMANELKIPHVIVSLIYLLLQGTVSFFYFLFFDNRIVYLYLILSFLCVIYLVIRKRYFQLHSIRPRV